MLFNHPHYFIFLGIVFFVLVWGQSFYKKSILVVASYTFYGLWDWRFTVLIFWSTLVDYCCGKYLVKVSAIRKRKVILIISIVNGLTILVFFKYFNFFINSFTELMNKLSVDSSFHTLNIILPVGISFYTFQSLSYTIDVYRKDCKPAANFLDYALYVSFFPQLVAGPIERASTLLSQIEAYSGLSVKNLWPGFLMLFTGYVKKVLIADNIAPGVDACFDNFGTLDSLELIKGLFLFSLQIYFDFSGYSDIARGTAKMLGINLQINFRQPYFARNLSDFWSRWHISLSSWMRDYLYIPLGGNKKGWMRTNINLMLTMLLGGLWHGASWNFVLWGGVHGVYLIISRLIEMFLGSRVKKAYMLRNILQTAFVFILVTLTWVPFRSPDFSATIAFFKGMVFWSGGVDMESVLLILFFVVILFVIDLPGYLMDDDCYLRRLPSWAQFTIVTVGVVGVGLTMFLVHGTARPFLYFQF
jgi:alginate O-acetyltransferase complex protein AlgI